MAICFLFEWVKKTGSQALPGMVKAHFSCILIKIQKYCHLMTSCYKISLSHRLHTIL